MSPKFPDDLLTVMTRLRRPDELSQVLVDLLTPAEMESLAERWAIIKLLDAGCTQREVRDRLGVSVTTVSRGSRQLKYGSGGFRLALNRLKGKRRN